MKRILSIAFLLLFLFNVGGYYLMFWALRSRATDRVMEQVASGLPGKDVLQMNFALALPYGINQKTYANVSNAFEVKGEFYRLVRSELVNDTLRLTYMKDPEQKRLANAMTDYAKVSNDENAPAKQSSWSSLATWLHDYTRTAIPEMTNINRSAVDLSFSLQIYSLITASYAVLTPPPKS